MKKRLKFIITATVIALIIAIGAIVIHAGAAPDASIVGFNLSFKDSVYITCAVKFENVPDGAECGILVFEEPRASYTVDTPSHTKITEVSHTEDFGDGLCHVYSYKGISAKEMTKEVYIVAFVNDGGNYTYSEPSKYSVLQYAYNKLGYSGVGTPSTDGEFIDLINALLAYGAEAQKYFGENLSELATDKYYMVIIEDGELSDKTDGGLYRAGACITLTAPAEKGGASFSHWVDGEGAILSDMTEFSYTVPEKNVTITAIYE